MLYIYICCMYIHMINIHIYVSTCAYIEEAAGFHVPARTLKTADKPLLRPHTLVAQGLIH